MRFVLFLVFLSTSLQAHEVQVSTQHLDIKKQNETAWQHDIIGRAVLSRKFDIGLQATYLERFDLHEGRFGGFLIYHPKPGITLEFRYLNGQNENEILPEDQYNFSAYMAWQEGLTPFLLYRDARYSQTHLHALNLGLEIEKIRHIILIPQIMFGKATFNFPAETKDVHNYGLRAIYYHEGRFSLFAFGYKGKEASQGIIGQSNIIVDTLSGGLGTGFYFTPTIRGEILIDHTDYEQLNNQFVTSTFNLQWVF